MASLQVLPNCLRFIDVRGVANSNLVVADQSLRLISYKGTNIESTVNLVEKPIAMTHFYTEQSQTSMVF